MKKYVAQVEVRIRIPVEVEAEDEDSASYLAKTRGEGIVACAVKPDIKEWDSLYAVCGYITEKQPTV